MSNQRILTREVGSGKLKPAFYNSPATDSQNSPWNGLKLEFHNLPPSETPEQFPAEHTLVLHLSSSIRVAVKTNGSWQDQPRHPNNILIFPTGEPIQPRRISQAADLLLLAISPKVLGQAVQDSLNPDQLNLSQKFLSADLLIQGTIMALKAEMDAGYPSGRLYGETLGASLAVHLIGKHSTKRPKLQNYNDGLPQHKLNQAIDYINAHLSQEIKLADLAQVVDISQFYFARLFKQSMGIAPYQYVIQRRIEQAKQLLKQSDLSISDISLRCGFAHQSHLSRHFRQLLGITPNAYRQL